MSVSDGKGLAPRLNFLSFFLESGDTVSRFEPLDRSGDTTGVTGGDADFKKNAIATQIRSLL